jgi:hypothetical protein
MNERDDLKPNGWSFYNPLPKDSSSNDLMRYWAVDISSITFTDIVQYDVLLLICDQNNVFQFDRTQREKLRKFVDGGGTLWIDYEGGTLNTASNFFMTRAGGTVGSLGFAGSGSQTAAIATGATGHPLVARPFPLATEDLQKLGGNYAITDGTGSAGTPDTTHFSAIMTDGSGNPIMSAAEYGSGRVVVTSDQLVAKICTLPGNPADMTNATTSDLQTVSSSCLELAYNIMNWGSEHTTVHRDARHTGFSFADIGGGLSKLWTYPDAAGETGTVNNPTSPAMLDDLVFYVDVSKTFHIFDLSTFKSRYVPQTDNGPMQTSTKGAPYVEVPVGGSATGYAFGSGANVSSPTAAYVPSASTGISIPAVFLTVQTSSGTSVQEFWLNTSSMTWNGPTAVGDTTFSLSSTAFAGTIPEPVYVDGSLYAVDGDGTIYCKDLLYGHTTWKYNSSSSGNDYGSPVGPPTVGYVRDVSTGSITQVAYLGTGGNQTSVNGTILPFPLRVFNEPISTNLQGSGTSPFMIRNVSCPIDSSDWSAFMPAIATDANPNGMIGQWDASANAAYGTSYPYVALDAIPNKFDINLDNLFNDFDGVNHSYLKNSTSFYPQAKGNAVIVDYGINPSNTAVPYQNRTPLDVKSQVASGTDGIVGTPALGPTDLLNFASKGGNTLGALYAVREGGRSSTRAIVKWRMCLEDSGMQALLGTTATAVGSPAVTKDMVYYAIDNGTNGFIVALKSDPIMRINLGGAIDRTQPVTISQYDSLNPTAAATEISGIPSDLTDPLRSLYATFVVDYDHGAITFNNLRPTMGAASDLSNSMDIQVTYTPDTGTAGTGVEQKILVPAFTGSLPTTSFNGLPLLWNNLAWVLELKPGDRPSGSPIVMGNHLYVGCKAVGTSNGYADLYSIDAAAMASVQTTSWPIQYTGSNFSSAIYCQAVSSHDIVATVAGANGMMAAVTQEGLTVLHNSISLVADTNRIIEVDSGGNLTWSCDSTHFYSQSNNNTLSDVAVPFNHPAVARYAPGAGIVVADTGNNRIVQIDKGGQILWQVVDFVDPKNLLPVGAPMTLNGPLDVSYWVDTSTAYPEYHYLIADTGNYRVLEVVARYNTTLAQYQNQLDWLTRTLDQGHQYRYTSARRVVQIDPNGSGSTNMYTLCVVSNYVPAGPASSTSTGLESVGGALVRICNTPAVPATDGCIDTNGVITDLGTNALGQAVRLQNPVFFDRIFDSDLTYWDTIVDAGYTPVTSGSHYGPTVYAVHHAADATVIDIQSFDAYQYDQYKASISSTGKFSPVYAQLMPENKGLLIVNRSTSSTTQGTTYGEVLEAVDWNIANQTFGTVSIIAPSGALTTSGQTSNSLIVNSSMYVPNQPTSAERRSY